MLHHWRFYFEALWFSCNTTNLALAYSGDCEGLADSTSSDQQEDRYGAGDTFVCCRLLVSLPLIRK